MGSSGETAKHRAVQTLRELAGAGEALKPSKVTWFKPKISHMRGTHPRSMEADRGKPKTYIIQGKKLCEFISETMNRIN